MNAQSVYASGFFYAEGSEKKMRHTINITVSKKHENKGTVNCHHLTVRERILRFLLGNPVKVTVIFPGDTVEAITIKEKENYSYEIV